MERLSPNGKRPPARPLEGLPVGKPLSGNVANGELAEDNLGAGFFNLLQLLVQDLPLGVDDGLVLADVVNTDLGVVTLLKRRGFGNVSEKAGAAGKPLFFGKGEARGQPRSRRTFFNSSSMLSMMILAFVYRLGCISKPAYENVFLKATPATRSESSMAPPCTFFMPIMFKGSRSPSIMTASTTSLLKNSFWCETSWKR